MRLPVARTIAVLGVVSLLTDVAGEMVQPLLPLYLVALGAGALAIGAVEGAADAAVSFVKVYSGRLADRLPRRKPLVLAGYGLAGVAKPLLAFAGAWPAVFALRAADRVGKGLRGAPRDAMIGDLAAEGQRGLAFGFHRAADTVGAILGPLLALLLLALVGSGVDGLRLVFLVTAVPMAGALLLLLFGVREASVQRVAPQGFAGGLPRSYWSTLAVLGLFALGRLSEAFFLLRASHLGADALEAVGLYVLFNLVYAGASIPVGRFSDRRGRAPVLAMSMVLLAAVCAGFATATTWWGLAPWFLLLGLHMAAFETVGRAYAVDLAPKEARGTALGWFHAVAGLAALPAGLAAGLLWETVAPWAAFAYAGSLALVAAVLLVALEGRRKGREAARRDSAAAGDAP